VDYIRHRAVDKDHAQKMDLSLIQQFGPTARKEIDRLLLEKLPDILTEGQKYNKIRNLLQEMRNEGSTEIIKVLVKRRWVLKNQLRPVHF
jgi:ATP-dependent DNA helicase RecG